MAQFKAPVDKDGSPRWDYAVAAENPASVAPWDDGDYIVTICGRPVGQAVSVADARIIVRWLGTALVEILGDAAQ